MTSLSIQTLEEKQTIKRRYCPRYHTVSNKGQETRIGSKINKIILKILRTNVASSDYEEEEIVNSRWTRIIYLLQLITMPPHLYTIVLVAL